jgi:hypothetical protein
MTKTEKIILLESKIEQLEHDRLYLRGCLARLEKRHEQLKRGITSVSGTDLAYMMEFEAANKDKDLFDVYNQFLYSFGRPLADGRVYPRLSCPRV